MEHTAFEIPLNTAERDFRDLIQHGDDFFKIEIFRAAKSWYLKALEMNIEPDQVKHKIAECDRLLAFEMKVFKILGIIAAVLVVVYLIL